MLERSPAGSAFLASGDQPFCRSSDWIRGSGIGCMHHTPCCPHSPMRSLHLPGAKAGHGSCTHIYTVSCIIAYQECVGTNFSLIPRVLQSTSSAKSQLLHPCNKRRWWIGPTSMTKKGRLQGEPDILDTAVHIMCMAKIKGRRCSVTANTLLTIPSPTA